MVTMVTTIQPWFCYSNQRVITLTKITITTLTYKTFILIRDLDKHAVEATEQKNAVVNHRLHKGQWGDWRHFEMERTNMT